MPLCKKPVCWDLPVFPVPLKQVPVAKVVNLFPVISFKLVKNFTQDLNARVVHLNFIWSINDNF